MPDLIVRGATILPLDRAGSILRGSDIAIERGRVSAIGAKLAVEGTRTIDAAGDIVLPGLCNAHTHSPEALARGLADRVRHADWVRAVWRDLDALDQTAIERAIKAVAAESLAGGVTSIVDHFRQTPMTRRAIDAAMRAWEKTGMRVTVAAMVRDRDVPDWVSAQPSADELIDVLASAARDWNRPDARVRFALGPSAPTRCTDAFLQALDRLARREQLRLHMHVDEAPSDLEAAHARFGTSAIRHLDRLGVLGPHVTAVHAVWSDDDDIDLLARHGAGVVHNPLANLRLGSGRMRLERFLAGGVPVAIGTDGAASNDSQNLLEALKMAVLLPRNAIDDPAQWPAARDGLTMVTRTANRLFDMSPAELAVGAPGDLAIFSRGAYPLSPEHDLHTQLALAGGGLRARHVIVAGDVLVYDHMLQWPTKSKSAG